jgi:hypothetical protein
VKSTPESNKTIPDDNPDIIFCEHENRTCHFIDTAISVNGNVIKNEVEEFRNTKTLS